VKFGFWEIDLSSPDELESFFHLDSRHLDRWTPRL